MRGGIKSLGRRGTAVLIGYTDDDLKIHPIDLILSEARVVSSVAASRHDLETAIALAGDGQALGRDRHRLPAGARSTPRSTRLRARKSPVATSWCPDALRRHPPGRRFTAATFSELAAWIESLGYDDLWLTDSSLHAGEVYVYATLALRPRRGCASARRSRTRSRATRRSRRTPSRPSIPGARSVRVRDRRRRPPLPELGLKVAKVSTLTKTVDVLRRLWSRGDARRPGGPVPYDGRAPASEGAG